MNPTSNPVATTSAVPVALAPPSHPQRTSTTTTSSSCDRHPDERFTVFCPSCLVDRLSVLNSVNSNNNNNNTVASSSKPPSSSAAINAILKPSSSGTEFRRTKSLSAREKKDDAFCLGAFEPRRKSCVRNTLWSLFNEDANHNNSNPRIEKKSKSPVFEIESEQEDIYCGNLEEYRRSSIVEEEEEKEEQMDLNRKMTKRESFWSAASVFSKRLQKWRQKRQKHRTESAAALPVEKSIGKQLRDTQSEIAEYGYGRRSCDTDPRFSIDAGRFSLDATARRISVDDDDNNNNNPRYSFDEPRASWDGYLIGRTARMTSLLSVVEDSPVRNHIFRLDTQIPVEEEEPIVVPGGSVQTRKYYSDSSSRRRKSLDRSRKAGTDEPRLSAASNAKFSHSSSLRDEIGVGGENAETMDSSKKETKKSKRWSWNIFGLLHRKNEKKCEDDGRRRRSGVDQTFSKSWNVETRREFDPRMMRSKSSVSYGGRRR